MTKCVLPWYNLTGWLSVKHQLTYLLLLKAWPLLPLASEGMALLPLPSEGMAPVAACFWRHCPCCWFFSQGVASVAASFWRHGPCCCFLLKALPTLPLFFSRHGSCCRFLLKAWPLLPLVGVLQRMFQGFPPCKVSRLPGLNRPMESGLIMPLLLVITLTTTLSSQLHYPFLGSVPSFLRLPLRLVYVTVFSNDYFQKESWTRLFHPFLLVSDPSQPLLSVGQAGDSCHTNSPWPFL